MRARHRIFLIAALAAVAALLWGVGSSSTLVPPETQRLQPLEIVHTNAAQSNAAPIRPAPIALPPEQANRVVLQAPPRRDDSPFVAIGGRDESGPRELLLWRIDGSGVQQIARGASRADGSLDFPPILAARDGMALVATAAGEAPTVSDQASALRVAPRALTAPRGVLREVIPIAHGEEELVLRIFPAEATGEVLLADAASRVFARYPLAAQPFAAERVLDVAVVLAAGERELQVAHELGDGRRSGWRGVELSSTAHGGGR